MTSENTKIHDSSEMAYKSLLKLVVEKDHIIINALSEESFQEQSIPGTYNLPVGQINPSNRDDIVEYFINEHFTKYPDLNDFGDSEMNDDVEGIFKMNINSISRGLWYFLQIQIFEFTVWL